MDIQGKRVLILGGAGLVGMAVARKMMVESPAVLIITSLFENEATEACEILKKEAPQIEFISAFGNVFVRDEFKSKPWGEILSQSDSRNQMIHDNLDDLDDEILHSSCLYKTIVEAKPDAIVDCINTATAVAYQDIYKSNYEVRSEIKKVKSGSDNGKLIEDVEKMMCTLYIPQLIRHVQIFHEAMKLANTGLYLKIGTSGTGGMGLNIPYTHSEEKPSRMLLSKSSVAGAHTLLLFLMARTPNGPIIKEIKPTAAIAWKQIAYGDVKRKGKNVQLFDCVESKGLKLSDSFDLDGNDEWSTLDGQFMKSVFIDTGENGIFSAGEFEAISSTKQMELVTPEEIAESVVFEIKGGNTGKDVVNALDHASFGPTYRAGVLRERALDILKELEEEHDVSSVSFELIGPLSSKLLFEADLFKKTVKTYKNIKETSAKELSEQLAALVNGSQKIRTNILSVGIPILMPDGETLLRGPEIKVPPYKGEKSIPITKESVATWSKDGWVDLRESNMLLWKQRITELFEGLESKNSMDTSSAEVRDHRYWFKDKEINIGKLIGWIFATELDGARIKG
ncbi:MAG: short-chain dehydrogenase [Candidatus Cloacimonadota bacterium]|nr:MAG: short-chain dehydrogenase [Candidatus Cloacimonadota bacterium]